MPAALGPAQHTRLPPNQGAALRLFTLLCPHVSHFTLRTLHFILHTQVSQIPLILLHHHGHSAPSQVPPRPATTFVLPRHISAHIAQDAYGGSGGNTSGGGRAAPSPATPLTAQRRHRLGSEIGDDPLPMRTRMTTHVRWVVVGGSVAEVELNSALRKATTTRESWSAPAASGGIGQQLLVSVPVW
jgi:hypothetical protein